MITVKVNDTSYIRDISNMALNNTNENERQEYYNKARILQGQKQEINKVKSEIQSIKNDMLEIKQMLGIILGKQNNG